MHICWTLKNWYISIMGQMDTMMHKSGWTLQGSSSVSIVPIFLCVHSFLQEIPIQCLPLSGTVVGAVKESCFHRHERSGPASVFIVWVLYISKHPPPFPLSGVFFWWQDMMGLRKMRRICVTFTFVYSFIYVFCVS